MKLIQIPMMFLFVANVGGFLIKNPLRQIVMMRAVSTSITEALAVNVFDVSAVMHELSCDCEQHPYLPVYVAGFICFSYMFAMNNNNDKFENLEFYSEMKKNLRQILFVSFLILGKNVGSVV
jgi:hypothetical protein